MPFHVPGRNLRLRNQTGFYYSEGGGVSAMDQVDSAADRWVGRAAATLGKD